MGNEEKRDFGMENRKELSEMMTIAQKEKALKQEKAGQELLKRRKRVNRMKNCIVVMICIISLMPVAISMFLLYQLSGLEQQVQYLASQKEAEQTYPLSEAQETVSDAVDETGEQDTAPRDKGMQVYLTFDDGPTKNTGEILDILKKNDVKATFFVIANEEYADQYREIVEQGHTIGIHSYSHDYSKIYGSLKAFREDVTGMSDLIYATTGVRTRLYRFPGGSANSVCKTNMNDLIQWIDDNGYIYYDWNALNGDAVSNTLSVKALMNNVLKNVKQNQENGVDSIVLMHDLVTKHNTIDALDPLIKELKKQGYRMDLPLTEDVAPVQQKKLEKTH